ncbi:schwannomin-interacting protein 1 isoform X1 [Stigmatopora argus]
MDAGDEERTPGRGDDSDEDGERAREDPPPPPPPWQDELGLPIMHWEALSLRIAELEKQEEEKKDKLAKNTASLERGRAAVGCVDVESWDDGRQRRHRHHAERPDDDDDAHLSALGSRLQTQMNLQLCFINNSESEDEEDEQEAAAPARGNAVAGHKTSPPAPKSEKSKSRGFRNTWRKLRERLRADHKPAVSQQNGVLAPWSFHAGLGRPQNPSGAVPPVRGRRLDRGDAHKLSLGELRAQRSFLAQSVQELSSDLVARLQLRDQLRTEQDAMLLELQDLTSLGSSLGAHG